MSRNLILTPQTAVSIDDRVDRLLRDLGYPEPPLRLEQVREFMRLDLQYYSSSDPTWLREKVHRLKIAGRQILTRPTLMLDVVRKLDLKALLLPDCERILVDAVLPSPKQRWSVAHEIVHRLLPWHSGAVIGDRKRTLSPACHRQVEGEANYGAGRLLFLGSRLRDEVRSEATVDFETVRRLSKRFGNSITTTLWRIVENIDAPAFGLVSAHPRGELRHGNDPVRYFIRSPQLALRFPSLSEWAIVQSLPGFCRGSHGPIGKTEAIISGGDGRAHVFLMECFCNHYDTLTLGTYRRVRAASVSML